MKRLAVASLRKGGSLLAEAADVLRSGLPLALPSECGYFVVREGGAVWLAAQPPEDSNIARVFWPGPLRLRLRQGDAKRAWQVPAHPLAQAFLALTGPVAADFVGGEPDLADGVLLDWKDPPLNLPVTEVDCACTPWRWLRSGTVERREFEWVAGQITLLSGPALPDFPLRSWPSPAPRRQSWRVEP